MTTTVNSNVRDLTHFIGGDWVTASDDRTFEDLDPYTGDVVARVAAGTRSDAKRAIDAAAAAFPAWSQTPPAVRQAIFLKAADIL
jgi:acyl-CoA reductase-like NAD-dependent aldehyde dehydrogenase